MNSSSVLRRLVDGFQVSQALYVAALLGIADLLVDGPRTNDELAAIVGAHPASLYRLLRALASVGVFQEYAARTFALTDVGDCLRADAAEPVGGWAAYVGRPHHWQAWSALLHSVQTGETAFTHVHGQMPWEMRARHPHETAIFDRAMTDLSRRASLSLLAAYDFGQYGRVVDVGGGQGGLLAAILAKHPTMHGVLFDQPHVVALAEPVLRAAGVSERCQVVSGNMFDTVPVGADAYLLKSILHDWPDLAAVEVLRTCRRAISKNGKLLVIERVLDPSSGDRDAAFSDLEMLVGNGGQERTTDEYAALLAAAGFRMEGFTSTTSGSCVIEGVWATN